MRALLICPSERPSVPMLSEAMPLSNVPLLGQSLLEYWLTHLATNGVGQVTILANDRVREVEAIVDNGVRWGLQAAVIKESRELTAAQALLKYESECSFNEPSHGIWVLDQLPGEPQRPLFESYAGCFSAVLGWMPRAQTPDRVGIRELKPGIWAGLNAHVSNEAVLKSPCWLGRNVFVGAGAVVGPNAIVEDGSFIEAHAEVGDSYVGPDTFVGRYTEVRDSLAWGDALVNWKTNSLTRVPDAFVLCSLRDPRRPQGESWLARVADVCSRNKDDLQIFWKHILMKREG